jgi:hypothetical protein
VNLSDHRAISGVFNLTLPVDAHFNIGQGRTQLFSRRWDKANLDSYYDLCRVLLAQVAVPLDCLDVDHCRSANCATNINLYYGAIRSALNEAAETVVPQIPCH